MNEPSGGSNPAPVSPRPNRRPPRRPRGRGPRRPQDNRPPQSPLPPGAAAIVAEHTAGLAVYDEPRRDETRSLAEHYPQPHRPIGSPIARAVLKVEEIIGTLKSSLRDLEEVLETLDDAQRQQIGDEKEIESLHRALSMLQRERQPSRDEPRDRRENRERLPGRTPVNREANIQAPLKRDLSNMTDEPPSEVEPLSSKPLE